VSRRIRPFPLEDVLLAQIPAGFLLAAGWSVMYEVYHEDGAYYTTLMQEILGTEGLFPYFLLSVVLMAVPLGLMLDALREVVGLRWLRLREDGGGAADELEGLSRGLADPEFAGRYLLYRHARAALLAPAKAAGNLAVVLAIFLLWFVVKIVRIEGWTVFSLPFIIGTPLVGLALIAVLLSRYRTGVRDFQRLSRGALAAPPPRPAPASAPSPQESGVAASPA